MYYTITVNGEECTDAVTGGSLSHHGHILVADRTFILAGYTVPCNRTVVAWEFCYRITGSLLTFYPGIWRITSTMNNGNTDYKLFQSNNITYNASIKTDSSDHINSCQRVNLPKTDQFTAPAESVVGLYSGVHRPLLYTNTNSSITTHRSTSNRSSVSATGIGIRYNIAIRVHLGKYSEICHIVGMYFDEVFI